MSVRFRFATVIPLVGAVLVGCSGGGGSSTDWEDPPLTEAAPDSLRRMQTVMAWVGDRPVTAGDVVRHMREATGKQDLSGYTENVDIFHVAMSGLLDQLVWGEKAKQDGYTLTPEERRRVHSLETMLLATRYVADVVEPKAYPPREEVEEYYRENQEQYVITGRVAVRHILVQSEDEARSILAEAQGGADFVDLVRKYSLDEKTKQIGGALGYVSEHSEILGIGHSHAFEDAVLPLDVGGMTVVQTDKGWHVARVEEKQGAGMTPLEDVYAQINSRLINRRFGNVYNEELAAAREAVDARVEQDGMEKVTGVTQNASRILEMALEHPEAGGRIELLRRIAFDYQGSDEAPEAQFRIGYIFIQEGQEGLSRKALMRLRKNYPDSPWRKAGDWLLENKPDPETMDSPEEILRLATGNAG